MTVDPRQPVHGDVVARRDGQGWRGVLIRGPSGVGKSDLALRLVAGGWRLVADDWACIWPSDGALYASAPRTIAGRIEVRGLGVVATPCRSIARIGLVVDCTHEAIERLPEPASWTWREVTVPRLHLDPRPASAVLVVACAMDAL